ncbi:gamma-glutamyl-gamma-aminobutyrate hydrolase family protein [Mycobacterium sp. 21AC1]|uniref:gamma-glutamyl-gamma-aminobutyrate hydrolase family protein n=1 Tax=[Mycobacterium] appelbergii TaxID=2939269 RepID=UPI002938E976|nr:gamma-glutamyl-gamma-aminobutyrate hydrolase family protein [Mycobacterium sp. 21AC1]MDV3130071.1 gamma-glutamyl-gamma-aminobutyrate hydrolase family protein [Mycobacterium sp. 21AC1]
MNRMEDAETMPTELAPITVDEVLPPTSGGDGPDICVVVPLNSPDTTAETRELVVRFTRTALVTLIDMGANPQVLDISAPDAPAPRPGVAGVLLLGGGDVDPTLYGHHGEVPNLYGVDRGCDDRTVAVINDAVSAAIPILGICRGSQLINVAYGGTLIPDLGPDTPHHGHGDDPLFVDDTVVVEEGSRLARILGVTRLTVRNGHHQAVHAVAPELRAAAHGLDGVVEGVEHRDPAKWVLGVQWHPEDTDGPAEARVALFGALLAQAAQRSGICTPT